MQLIVCDRVRDGVLDGRNFREVAYCEAFARRTANKVVCWVLVGIGRLLTASFDDFPDGVDSKTLMRIDCLTLSISDGLGKIVRINAAREKLGTIVVNGLVIHD